MYDNAWWIGVYRGVRVLHLNFTADTPIHADYEDELELPILIDESPAQKTDSSAVNLHVDYAAELCRIERMETIPARGAAGN